MIAWLAANPWAIALLSAPFLGDILRATGAYATAHGSPRVGHALASAARALPEAAKDFPS